MTDHPWMVENGRAWGVSDIHRIALLSACKFILVSLHFNENVKRENVKTKQGEPCVRVYYRKFKLGEEVVREVAVPSTYGMFMAIISQFLLHGHLTNTDCGRSLTRMFESIL